MDFAAKETRIPTTIGDIRVLLEVKRDESESAEYTIQILDQKGSIIEHTQGDLVPYLTATQTNGLRALMAALRTKAQKILPI